MMKNRMMMAWMERLAGAVGWMMLAVVVALGMTGCGRDPLMVKAKKAEKDGNINFFGFYTGMPRADADVLAARHGLTGVDELMNFALSFDFGFSFLFGLDDASMFHENPETHEVYAMLFSFQDVQRMTKAGTFKELSKAVAKQVGELEYDGKVAKRKSWNGDALYIFKEQEFCMLFDESRAHAGREAKEREKERVKFEAERQKAEQVEAKLAPLNEKIRAGETRTPGDTKTIVLPGGVTMEMVWCPPGTFVMGSPEDEEGRSDDEIQHQVTLTKGFWLAKTEVTQKQWTSVMGYNPSEFVGENLPVDSVSWNACQQFCKKTGMRLPTEAEWEYACRADSMSAYGGTGRLKEMGWYDGNFGDSSHPVGQKRGNAWGLQDMHGNVWEWCADWYGEYPDGAVTNPKGSLSGESRVFRGGCSVCGFSTLCRSAERGWVIMSDLQGFRPAMDLLAEETQVDEARLAELEAQRESGQLGANEQVELLELYRKRGQGRAFLQLVEQLLDSPETPPESIARIAAMFLQDQRIDAYAYALERYLERDPRNWGALTELAVAEVYLGREAEAVNALKQALAAGGDVARQSISNDARFQALEGNAEFRKLFP